MTFAPVIHCDFGPIGVHTVYWVLMVVVGYLCFQGGRVWTDRQWNIWKRSPDMLALQQINAPWLYAGEPIVLNRADARDTIYKANPYREDGFEPLRWAA